jgi:hypothetical protein
MGIKQYYEIPQFSAILSFLDAIFSEINIGLLIYHVENVADIHSARLIYANRQASKYTGTDLQKLVGKFIFDAFPGLLETDIPRLYGEVVTEKQARLVGVIEYSDERVKHGKYSTRAFPMPSSCLGIAFTETSDTPDESAPE